MHRLDNAVINILGQQRLIKGSLRLSFSDKTIKLSYNAQFLSHAYIKDSLIVQWFGFKASWLISKGLGWRHISRPVVNYCLHVIYSLPLPGETQRGCEGGSWMPSSCIMEIWGSKTFLQTCAEITNASLDHSTTTLYCQCPRPCLHFYPSHFPPLPNLYVNSLFLKQCNMHIYPSVAEAQKHTINGLSPHMESNHVSHCNLVL